MCLPQLCQAEDSNALILEGTSMAGTEAAPAFEDDDMDSSGSAERQKT
jgi:hypothetical protein